MPTYTYRCPACEHQLERFDKMDAPVPPCPTCGTAMERVITGGAGLVFKGSGFYITDYGKDGKGPPTEKGGSAGEVKAKSESKTAPEKSAAKESPKKPAAGGDS